MKKILWSISLLNLLDLLITVIGVKLEIIEEANPLLLYLWEKNIFYVISLKVFISLLFFFTPFYLPENFPRKKIWTKVVILVLIIYSLVFSYHIFWIALYLFLN